jgi:hypothetical protein
MKLPNWTQTDAQETGNELSDMTHERNLAMSIVETFEDLLDTHNIVIPDPDRSDDPQDEQSCIYGLTYDALVSDIADKIENYNHNIDLQKIRGWKPSVTLEHPTALTIREFYNEILQSDVSQDLPLFLFDPINHNLIALTPDMLDLAIGDRVDINLPPNEPAVALNTVKEVLAFIDQFDGYGMIGTDEDLQVERIREVCNVVDDYKDEDDLDERQFEKDPIIHAVFWSNEFEEGFDWRWDRGLRDQLVTELTTLDPPQWDNIHTCIVAVEPNLSQDEITAYVREQIELNKLNLARYPELYPPDMSDKKVGQF